MLRRNRSTDGVRARSDNAARPERPVEAVAGREGADRRTEPRCGGPQWPCGCSGRQPVTGRRPGGEPIGGPRRNRPARQRDGPDKVSAIRRLGPRSARDKRAVLVHGERDQATRPRAPAYYVQRARTAGARAGMILVRNGDRAMLRRSSLWHRTAPSPPRSPGSSTQTHHPASCRRQLRGHRSPPAPTNRAGRNPRNQHTAPAGEGLGDRPQVGRQYCENADLPSTGSV